MPNIFDNMQNTMFDVTTTTFGYDAVWNGETGRVHYRRPNEKDMMENGIAFMPFTFFMEYKEGVFEGLQESVHQGNTETVLVNGVNHEVRSVFRAYDGKTFQAHIERLG